jgi:predicted permease
MCCVGFFAARYPVAKPLLSKPALQYISRLSTFIFIPCLSIASLGASINFRLFSQIGFLVVCCPIVTAISYCLSETIGKLLMNKNIDKGMATAVSVACCFANTISLPIMIMQTLCEEDIVNADYEHSAQLCGESVSGMIFLYGAGFHAIYWTNAVTRLRMVTTSADGTVGGDGNQPASVFSFEYWKKVLTTPAIIGVIAGLCIGLFRPAQYYLFESSTVFYSLGSTIKTLGQPVVAIQSLIMSASLGHVELSSTKTEAASRIASSDARRRVVEMISPRPESNRTAVYSAVFQDDASLSEHGSRHGSDVIRGSSTVRTPSSDTAEEHVEETKLSDASAHSAIPSSTDLVAKEDVLPDGWVIFSMIVCK